MNADEWLAQVVGRNGGEIAQLSLSSSLLGDVEGHADQPGSEGSTVCTQTPRTWMASRHIVSSVISADSAGGGPRRGPSGHTAPSSRRPASPRATAPRLRRRAPRPSSARCSGWCSRPRSRPARRSRPSPATRSRSHPAAHRTLPRPAAHGPSRRSKRSSLIMTSPRTLDPTANCAQNVRGDNRATLGSRATSERLLTRARGARSGREPAVWLTSGWLPLRRVEASASDASGGDARALVSERLRPLCDWEEIP